MTAKSAAEGGQDKARCHWGGNPSAGLEQAEKIMSKKSNEVKQKREWVSRSEFSEQYRSPAWQKRRLERLDAAGWECGNCGDSESQLHVHHTRYVAGRKIWDYSDEELQILCEACHSGAHALKERLNEALASIPGFDLGKVVGYALAAAATNRLDCAGNEGALTLSTNEEVFGAADYFGVDWHEIFKIGAQGERPTARRLIDLRMRNAMACSDPKNAGSQ